MSDQKTAKRPLTQNEHEIEVLKAAFADNEEVLMATRALFLGFPITKTQADLVVSTFKVKDVVLSLRKKMFPAITADTPVGEASDFWLGTETEIIGRNAEEIRQVVMSKQTTLDMLEKAFALLKDPSGERVSIEYDPRENEKSDPYHIKLLARNKYVKTVETGLMIVKAIAGQKSETVEQAKRRLMADSAK